MGIMFVFGLFLAYFLGSIPSAVWIGKWLKGIDVRQHGSKNAGATNTFRVLGKGVAIPVLLIDIAKGVAAVGVMAVWAPEDFGFLPQILAGIAAVLGHVFPIFANFNGGKGVATLMGVGLMLYPPAALASLGIFIMVFAIGKFVSLGSISAAVSYPIWILWVFAIEDVYLCNFAVLIAVVVVVTHKNNIKRLLNGQEKKISFSSKKR